MDIANHATQSADRSEEESGSNCPTFYSFYDQRGPESIKSITGFTREDFKAVWLLMAEYVARCSNIGRRRKSRVSGSKALLMLSTVIKYGQHCNFLARLFVVNGNAFERLIVGHLKAALEHTYEVHVKRTEEKWKTFKCIKDRKMSRRLDYAHYATDVTSSQSCRPSGSATEGMSVFQESKSCMDTKLK